MSNFEGKYNMVTNEVD